MVSIRADIPDILSEALKKHLNEHAPRTINDVVKDALESYLEDYSNALYQVSTAGALVEGIYHGATSTGKLLEHGDFGLGTFESLDGEMIVLDGRVYRARGDGSVEQVSLDLTTPFAVVTQFRSVNTITLENCNSLKVLQAQFDNMRNSSNYFYALRVTGMFDKMHLRAVCKTKEGVPLVQAAAVQPEFNYTNIEGTLVGFWSPAYAKSLVIPGYHMHFLSKEHNKGGHLLDCSGKNLRCEIQRKIGFTTALSAEADFSQADLSRDPSKDLEKAETKSSH